MSNPDSTFIARTIFSQLGGQRFAAMTGAKHLTSTDKGLAFRLPARFAKNGINYVNITLDSMDTYSVTFYKAVFSRGQTKLVKSFDGVYNDMLQNIFTDATGLDTHL